MLTLGLGMMIGAQAAGKIEGQHTPQAAKDLNAQVVAKSGEIEKLSESIEGEPSEEVKASVGSLLNDGKSETSSGRTSCVGMEGTVE